MMRRFWLVLAPLLLLGAAEPPRPAVRLSPAEAARQGNALVADLLTQRPAKDITNTGVLRIRGADGKRLEFPLMVTIIATSTNWLTTYQVLNTNQGRAAFLCVAHQGEAPNRYAHFDTPLSGATDFLPAAGLCADASFSPDPNPNEDELMKPFAESDFWVADLGLEFLHWPGQKVLKAEIRRGQSCRVLESVNPHPAPETYARVLSWIDADTGGIIYAEAYDTRGKVLKEFKPNSVKKVRGEWQLREMEMENRQTRSRTWIEFDLKTD
jgi:hypothetical protein